MERTGNVMEWIFFNVNTFEKGRVNGNGNKITNWCERQ